jgi:type IV pilus assembly protein PilQ
MPQDQQFFDVPNSATPYSPPKDSVIYPYGNAGTPGTPVRNLRPGFGPYNAPWQTGQLEPIYDETNKEVKKYNLESPKNLKYPPNKIFDYLAASVISGNAKSLADPTLLVQEGESAKVEAVTSVITNVSSTSNSNNTTTSSTTRENAGLTLKVDVIKIDDNGFVTLNLRPEVSIANPSGGEGLVGGVRVSLNNITKRSLDSGKVRLRDGQALFLTGVMQENMFTSATKWPVLGDLPFFGQFFRKTNTGRRKSELVIVVTPRIIDDEQGGSYGYGFQPSSAEARRLIYPQ